MFGAMITRTAADLLDMPTAAEVSVGVCAASSLSREPRLSGSVMLPPKRNLEGSTRPRLCRHLLPKRCSPGDEKLIDRFLLGLKSGSGRAFLGLDVDGVECRAVALTSWGRFTSLKWTRRSTP